MFCFVRTICVCSVKWHIIVFALWEANTLWYACTPCWFSVWRVVWLRICKKLWTQPQVKLAVEALPTLAFLQPKPLIVQSVSGLRESESSTSLLSFVVIRTIHAYSADVFCQEAVKAQCELTSLITFWYSSIEMFVRIMVHAQIVIIIAEIYRRVCVCVCV